MSQDSPKLQKKSLNHIFCSLACVARIRMLFIHVQYRIIIYIGRAPVSEVFIAIMIGLVSGLFQDYSYNKVNASITVNSLVKACMTIFMPSQIRQEHFEISIIIRILK